jgi:CO/xanthine dehydrogenase FAD-binding subunit
VLRLPPISIEIPSTIQDAAKAIADGKTRLVAGGTDLWPNMKRRHQKAETVVSLMSIPELGTLDIGKVDIRIGATTTLANVVRQDTIRKRFPAFAKAVASISSPPLRDVPITTRPKNGVVRSITV